MKDKTQSFALNKPLAPIGMANWWQQKLLHDASKESERQYTTLQEQKELFESVFHDVPDAMVVADEERRIVLCNAAITKTFGYQSHEVLGKKTIMFYESEEEYIRQGKERFNLSAEEKLKPYIVNYRRKDGSVFPGETVGTILRDQRGKMLGFLGLMRDVTQRLQIEEERLDLERQVQHTQKLKSLGVLTGGIAHDFNNILMAIRGNTDLAMMDITIGKPGYENLVNIDNAVRQAAHLVNQMLAYSGMGKFESKPISMNQIVEEMSKLLKVSISKKVELKMNFSPSLPRIIGDLSQIQQIILNLITNASDAIGNHSGVINLSTGTLKCDRECFQDISPEFTKVSIHPPTAGNYVYLEVSDDGCGMDNETLSKIFDPFFTTKFAGRGLGMASVQGIVRSHGGFLKVTSEEGKGTTFRIFFPEMEETTDLVPQPQEVNEMLEPGQNRGTILLADDEEFVLDVTRKMLEHFGYTVLIASDGLEAIEVFQEHIDEICCILLDLTMPQLDGEQVFERIRKMKPSTKVIICSGYSEHHSTEKFAGKGVAGFLNKPFTLEALSRKLNQVICSC